MLTTCYAFSEEPSAPGLEAPILRAAIQVQVVLVPSSRPSVPSLIVTSPSNGANHSAEDDADSIYSQASDDLKDAWPFELEGLDTFSRPPSPEFEDKLTCPSMNGEDKEDADVIQDPPIWPAYPVPSESKFEDTFCADTDDEDAENKCGFYYELEDSIPSLSLVASSSVQAASPVLSKTDNEDVPHEDDSLDYDEYPEDKCPFYYELDGPAPILALPFGTSIQSPSPAFSDSGSEDALSLNDSASDSDNDEDPEDKCPFYYQLEKSVPTLTLGSSMRSSSLVSPESDEESLCDESKDPEDLCPFYYELEEPVSDPSELSISSEPECGTKADLKIDNVGEDLEDDDTLCCDTDGNDSTSLMKPISPQKLATVAIQSTEMISYTKGVLYVPRPIESSSILSQTATMGGSLCNYLVTRFVFLPLINATSNNKCSAFSHEPGFPKSNASARRSPVNLTQLTGPSWNPLVQEVIVLVSARGPGVPWILVTSPNNGSDSSEKEENQDEDSMYSQTRKDVDSTGSDLSSNSPKSLAPSRHREQKACSDEENGETKDLCAYQYGLKEATQFVLVELALSDTGANSEDGSCADDSDSDDNDPEDKCAFYYELDELSLAPAPGPSTFSLSPSLDLGSDVAWYLDNKGNKNSQNISSSFQDLENLLLLPLVRPHYAELGVEITAKPGSGNDGGDGNSEEDHAFCCEHEENKACPCVEPYLSVLPQPPNDCHELVLDGLAQVASPSFYGGDVSCTVDRKFDECSADKHIFCNELEERPDSTIQTCLLASIVYQNGDQGTDKNEKDPDNSGTFSCDVEKLDPDVATRSAISDSGYETLYVDNLSGIEDEQAGDERGLQYVVKEQDLDTAMQPQGSQTTFVDDAYGSDEGEEDPELTCAFFSRPEDHPSTYSALPEYPVALGSARHLASPVPHISNVSQLSRQAASIPKFSSKRSPSATEMTIAFTQKADPYSNRSINQPNAVPVSRDTFSSKEIPLMCLFPRLVIYVTRFSNINFLVRAGNPSTPASSTTSLKIREQTFPP